MSDMAERGVKFMLLAELAPSAKAIIDDFSKTIKGLQAQVDELTIKAASATSAAASSAASAASASAQKAEAEVVRSASVMSAAMEASVPTNKLEQLYQIQSALLEMKQQREEAIYTNSLERMEQAYEEYENAKATIAESAAQRTADLLDFMEGRTTEMPERGGLHRDDESGYVEAFRKQAESTQAEFEKIEAKREAQSNKSVEDELNRQIKAAEAFEKSEQKKADTAERALKKKAEADQKAADKKAERDAKSAEQESERIDKLVQRALEADDKKIESAEKAVKKARAAQEKADQAESDRIDKLVQKAIDADNKEIDSAKRKDEQKAESAAKSAERQMERSHAAARQVISNALEMGESVMRIGRGFMALGLVGERELGKLTDAMLKAQAAMDFMMGISRSLQKIDEGYRLLRQSILAAAAAQEALNAATAMGGVGGGGGGARGGGVDGSLAAGAAGGAGGSILTRMLVGAGGYAVGGLGAVGNSVAGGLAPLGGAGALGVAGAGAATVGAAFLAALGGLTFGITSAVMVIKEASERGIGGGGAYSEAVGNSSFNPFSYFTHPIARAMERDEKPITDNIAKQQGNITSNNADQAKILSFEEEVAKLRQESFRLEQARKIESLETLSPLGKQAAIMREIGNLRSAANSGDQAAGDAISKWQDQRLRNEQQIATIKIQSAQEAIRLAQSELVEVERKQAAIISANQSAAERFGMLDEDKQQEIIAAKQRLNAGTASAEDLRLSQGFSGQTDERIKQLSLQRARAAGFGIFEQEAINEVRQLDGIKRKLEIEVKQNTEFVVRIDEDLERLSQRIASEVAKVKGLREKELTDKVNEALKKIGDLQTSIKQRSAS